VRRIEQQLFEELGVAPSPQAVADRVGLPYPKLMQLYKAFRSPTSRDAGPLGPDAGGDDKNNTSEQWVEEVDEVRRWVRGLGAGCNVGQLEAGRTGAAACAA